MLSEQSIESKIIQAINALGITGLYTSGVWTPSTSGTVRNVEPNGTEIVCVAKVNPRSYESDSAPCAIFTASISIAARDETDPDGSRFLAVVESVTNLLDAWQKNYTAYEAAFAADNFSPAFFRLDGGDIAHEEAASVWTWNQTMTFRGVI